jgi:hypothetical protein
VIYFSCVCGLFPVRFMPLTRARAVLLSDHWY